MTRGKVNDLWKTNGAAPISQSSLQDSDKGEDGGDDDLYD